MRPAPSWSSWAVLLALGAGLADLATGIALLAVPRALLAVGMPFDPSGEVFLRWIGVFVAAVGAAVLGAGLAARRGESGDGRAGRAEWDGFRRAVRTTSLVRLAVAAFVASAVMAAELDAPWLAIGLFDAGVGAAQLAGWRRPIGERP